ncbi:hypothetical protein ACQ4PT_056862 [Festuca glaucescens]
MQVIGARRSESPSPVLKAKGTTFRAASSSPVGMQLSRMPRLKPWRGPLPRHRITPALVVADCIVQAVSRMPMAVATENVTRSSPPAGRSRKLGRCPELGSPAPSLQSSSSTAEEGRGIPGVQNSRDEAGPARPWAKLGWAILAFQRSFSTLPSESSRSSIDVNTKPPPCRPRFASDVLHHLRRVFDLAARCAAALLCCGRPRSLATAVAFDSGSPAAASTSFVRAVGCDCRAAASESCSSACSAICRAAGIPRLAARCALAACSAADVPTAGAVSASTATVSFQSRAVRTAVGWSVAVPTVPRAILSVSSAAGYVCSSSESATRPTSGSEEEEEEEDTGCADSVRCPILKLPKPLGYFVGCGNDATLNLHLPDSVHKPHLMPSGPPTALVQVCGESVPPSTIQSLVARMCPSHANWKWEAIAHGPNSYLIAIPSAEDLARIDGMQMGVPNIKAQVSVSSWKREDVAPLFVMEPAWIHVDGVPHTIRHFHGLWAVGSLIGSTLDVHLVSLRSQGIVRILIIMRDLSTLQKDVDGVNPPCLEEAGDDDSHDGLGEDRTNEPSASAPHDGAMDVDAAPQSAGGFNSAAAPVFQRVVTPYNHSPSTPRGKEIVAKVRVTSPSLIALFPSLEGSQPASPSWVRSFMQGRTHPVSQPPSSSMTLSTSGSPRSPAVSATMSEAEATPPIGGNMAPGPASSPDAAAPPRVAATDVAATPLGPAATAATTAPQGTASNVAPAAGATAPGPASSPDAASPPGVAATDAAAASRGSAATTATAAPQGPISTAAAAALPGVAATAAAAASLGPATTAVAAAPSALSSKATAATRSERAAQGGAATAAASRKEVSLAAATADEATAAADVAAGPPGVESPPPAPPLVEPHTAVAVAMVMEGSASSPRSSPSPSTVALPLAFSDRGQEGSTSRSSPPSPRSSTPLAPTVEMPPPRLQPTHSPPAQ